MKKISIAPVAIIVLLVSSFVFATSTSAQTNLPNTNTVYNLENENGPGGGSGGEGGPTSFVDQLSQKEVFENVKLYSSDNIVYLELVNNSSDVVSIKVYDATGRKIISRISNNSQNISCEFNKQLPRGIYILELTNNNNKYTHKFYL